MFDPTEFEKLQQQLSANLEKTLKKFEKAFESLPSKIQKAFDASFLSKFEKTIQGIEDATGETVKEIEKAIQRSKKYAEILDDQAQKVQDIIDLTREQAKSERASIKNLIKQSQSIDEILELEEKALQIADDKNEAVAKLAKLLKAVQAAQEGNLAQLDAQAAKLTEANIAQQQGIAMQKIFGMSLSKAKSKAVELWQVWGNIRGVINLAAISVGLLVRQMIQGYNAFRMRGMNASQAVQQIPNATAAQFSGAFHGVFAGNQSFAAAQGDLGNNLGQIQMNRGLVEETVNLTKYYHVNGEAAAKMVAQLNRQANFSAKTATNTLATVRGLAVINKIGPGTIMQDMANHTEAMAMYAGRGMESLAKGLIISRQMGTNFNQMSTFFDSLVDDFEGSLKMQAQLQTYLPGLDLSKTMYDAQYGNDGDAQKDLQQALQSTGLKTLDQLPRSVRNQIAKVFGAENMPGLLGKGAASDNGFKTDTSGYSDTTANWQNSMADFISNNKVASTALALLAAWATRVAFSGTIGGMGSVASAAGGGWGGARSAFMSRAGVGSGALAALIGGTTEFFNSKNQGASTQRSMARGGMTGALTGLGMWGGGALGTMAAPFTFGLSVPIGAMLGASLGGYFGNKLSNKVAPIQAQQLKFDGLNNLGDTPDNSKGLAIDTTSLEKKFDTLIQVTQGQKVIHMDGIKVGQVVTNANSRR